MRSFQEAGELGGWKQSDVAGSPSPDNHRILLVHHLVENAGEIFTQTRICCFSGHHAPQSVSYSIPVRVRRSSQSWWSKLPVFAALRLCCPKPTLSGVILRALQRRLPPWSLLDRVEVVRGPATLMYGSSAIGGVVDADPNDLWGAGRHGSTNSCKTHPAAAASESHYTSPDNHRPAAAC
jgi:hypothetical protein